MKPVYIKLGMCIDYGAGNNNTDPKFKIVDHVTILKFKNIFGKQ